MSLHFVIFVEIGFLVRELSFLRVKSREGIRHAANKLGGSARVSCTEHVAQADASTGMLEASADCSSPAVWSAHHPERMSYEQSQLTKLRRSVKRGSYDKVVVNEILDAALVAHVAYVDGDGQAKVSPMIFGREGESLYLHGHVSAGALRNGSIDVCFCVTLEDGLVLARANMHSSMNYRCVVVHGQATDMPEEDLKRHGLDVITDHMCQGQAARARPMTSAEVASTRVLRLKLEDGKVSAKIRAEGVNDDKEDIEQLKHIWAGVIPITRVYGPPENNHDSSAAPPPIVMNYPKFRSGKLGDCGCDWNSTSVALVGAVAAVAAGFGFVLGVTAKRAA